MNLMNVLSCKWDDALLHACGGPELRSKIGPEPVPGGTVLGKISNYWVARWGFSPGAFLPYLRAPSHVSRLSRRPLHR